MGKRLLAPLAVLLAGAGVALLLRLDAPAPFPAAPPAPPGGDLGRFLPLAPGAEPLTIDFDWLAGEARSIVVLREVPRWEQVAGQPHARVVHRRAMVRSEELYLVEWLRADGDAIVCPLREVAEVRHRLEPPQPILRLPLRPGHAWSWSGTVDGRPAQARFEVLSRRPDETHGEVLEVRSETTLEGETTAVVTRYAAGLGPFAAHGSMPRGDVGIQTVQFEAKPYDE